MIMLTTTTTTTNIPMPVPRQGAYSFTSPFPRLSFLSEQLSADTWRIPIRVKPDLRSWGALDVRRWAWLGAQGFHSAQTAKRVLSQLEEALLPAHPAAPGRVPLDAG